MANGCTADTASGRDRIAMRVMGLLMPKPSEVEAMSRSLLGEGRTRAEPTGSIAPAAMPATCAALPSPETCWNTQTTGGRWR